jgi:hypothetical protein
LKKLLALAVAVITAGVGAWVIATRVESPAQAAARAQPPPPDPVVAALETGFLRGPITMATTAQYERTTVVKPPAALTGVVTFPGVTAGQTLDPGSVLLRANGRPVFALPGAFALYRDIHPGDSGDDVASVQVGLRAAGYATGSDRPGVYGPGTQRAVSRLYQATGHAAPVTTVEPSAAPAAPAGGTVPAPAPGAAPGSPAATGPRVVMTEFVMVPDLPAVVQAVAAVGTPLTGDTELVTLGTGRVLLAATLPNGSSGAPAVGATGTFTDDTGATASADVVAAEERSATADTLLTLAATGTVAPGGSYLVSIANPAAEAGESLLAPVAAVVTRGGRSYLYARDGEQFVEVEVQVVGSVGGIAAISPVGTAVALQDGTDVRIG